MLEDLKKLPFEDDLQEIWTVEQLKSSTDLNLMRTFTNAVRY